jgi:hypothetical protein
MEQKLYVDNKQVAHATDDERRAANATYKIADAQLDEQKRQNKLLEENAKAATAHAQAQLQATQQQARELARQSRLQEEQLIEAQKNNARTAAHQKVLQAIATEEAQKAESHRQYTQDVMWLEKSDDNGKAEFILKKYQEQTCLYQSVIVQEISSIGPDDAVLSEYKTKLEALSRHRAQYMQLKDLIKSVADAQSAATALDKSVSGEKRASESLKTGLKILAGAVCVGAAFAILLSLAGSNDSARAHFWSVLLSVSITFGILALPAPIVGYFRAQKANKKLAELQPKKENADKELQAKASQLAQLKGAHDSEESRLAAMVHDADQRLLATCHQIANEGWNTQFKEGKLREGLLQSISHHQKDYPPLCRPVLERVSEQTISQEVNKTKTEAVSTVATILYADCVKLSKNGSQDITDVVQETENEAKIESLLSEAKALLQTELSKTGMFSSFRDFTQTRTVLKEAIKLGSKEAEELLKQASKQNRG